MEWVETVMLVSASSADSSSSPSVTQFLLEVTSTWSLPSAVVCWPFSGSGPMGKPPMELGYARPTPIVAVAAHPRGDLVAAGYADGALALARIQTANAGFAKPPGGGRVSALAFSPDGNRLAFGTEDGLAGVIDLP